MLLRPYVRTGGVFLPVHVWGRGAGADDAGRVEHESSHAHGPSRRGSERPVQVLQVRVYDALPGAVLLVLEETK